MQYKVFGCKVNKYYTDRWLNSEYLRDKTGTFVASCVVTDNAKRKWIRFVKKELQNLDEGKIYISWCWAFKDGKAQKNFFEIYPELAHAQDKIEVLDEAPDENKNSSQNLSSESPLLKGEEDKIIQPLSPWGEKIQDSGFEWKMEKKSNIDLSKLDKLKNLQKKQIFTKKYVLIQGWCDSFCTFCLTVQKRGRHFFRAKEDIAEEIRDFQQEGGKEVVLTWVNLSAWGLSNTHDIKNFSPDLVKNGQIGSWSKFAELLEYLLKNTKIPRLRISSLGPEFIDDACLKVFENERIYPHFHFSIQSGSSEVLRSMARHYDGVYMRELLEKVRKIHREDWVEISIWADLIVWFPGETEENFRETYNLVQDLEITKVHAFPFSAHTMGESVPAGKFKNQIEDSIKTDRMNRLMRLAEEVREKFKQKNKGKILKVLVEKSSAAASFSSGRERIQDWVIAWKKDVISWSGWTQNYIHVDESSFEIISWVPEKNTIIVWKLQ